ncbi:DEAD/DEAH box helicase, partial [Aduncisulcus paluster]
PTVYDGKIPVRAVNTPQSQEIDEDSKVDNLLRVFEHVLDDSKKTPIRVEFQLEFNDQVDLYGYSAALSLRIGEDRLYIVKDIKNFLKCVAEEETEFFSKNFEFNGKIHTFDSASLQAINMLVDIYEDEAIRENSRFINDKTSHVFDRKHILLSSNRFLKLIKLVNHNNLYITDGTNVYSAKIVEDSPSFDFHIDDFEEQICLRLYDDYKIRPADKAFKILFNGLDTLYLTKRQDRSALMKVHELFHLSSEILLPMNRIEDLANTVFPVLKKVGKLHLSELLSDRMVERNLEKRLFVDYGKEGISIRVQFAYGDVHFDPAEERSDVKRSKLEKSDDIIVRDTAEEKKFLSQFSSRVFKTTEKGYLVSGDHNEYLFLSDYAPVLMETAVVYATDAYRKKRVISDAKIHQSVRLSSGEDYLEYNFAIDGLGEKELKDVLKAYRQKKNYYKLKEGGFISLKNDSF